MAERDALLQDITGTFFMGVKAMTGALLIDRIINLTTVLRQCWLTSLLRNKETVWPHLVESYGEDEAATWYNRWVVYHIAGAEFFATGQGEVTGVSHYLFEKPKIS